MRILLTGAKGYIGSKIFKDISKKHNVLPIDIKSGISVFDAMHPKGRFFEATLNFRPDCIINTAATPRIPYSFLNPLDTMENNVITTSICLNFCRISKCKRFVHSSSSSAKYPENSPYSLQKSVSEKECQLYRSVYGIETYALRYFNVYSDYKDYKSYDTLLSRWMQASKNKEPLRIHGDGNQRRDMIHLDDVVSANVGFAEGTLSSENVIQEIGTGENLSVNEVAEMFKKYGRAFVFEDERKNDVRESLADLDAFSPKIKISEGVFKAITNFFEGRYEDTL